MPSRTQLLARLLISGFACLLLAAALALAACGGGTKKVAADKWTDNVCSLAADYKKVTDAQGDKLAAVDPEKDPKGTKAAMLAAFTEVGKAEDTFKAGLGKAGQPDLKSGADVVKAFNAHMDASKKTLTDARTKIDKLDAGSKTFADDLTKVLDDLSKNEKDFRGELQAVIDKQADAQAVMDGIDANSDCADVLFKSGSSDAKSTTPTPAAKATPRASATAAKTAPVARTTPKPNASKNEKWVIGLCVATQSFVDDIEALSNGVDPNKAGNDTQKLKDMMVKFMQDARDRSRQFKQDVDRLQAPDVKDGPKIQSSMSNAANQVVALFEKALTDAKALDGTNAQKLASGLQNLGDSLSTASDDISAAFENIDTQYDTTELTKIGDSVPECASFFN